MGFSLVFECFINDLPSKFNSSNFSYPTYSFNHRLGLVRKTKQQPQCLDTQTGFALRIKRKLVMLLDSYFQGFVFSPIYNCSQFTAVSQSKFILMYSDFITISSKKIVLFNIWTKYFSIFLNSFESRNRRSGLLRKSNWSTPTLNFPI
jgi:hypothetical protein